DQRRGDRLGRGGEVLAHPGLVEAEAVGEDDRLAILAKRFRQVTAEAVKRHHEQPELHPDGPSRPSRRIQEPMYSRRPIWSASVSQRRDASPPVLPKKPAASAFSAASRSRGSRWFASISSAIATKRS